LNLQLTNCPKACYWEESFCWAHHPCWSQCAFIPSNLFDGCLMHGNILWECMEAVIVLFCKRKKSDLNDEPVSLVTIISKLFQHFILHHHWQDNQFSLNKTWYRYELLLPTCYIILSKQRHPSVYSILRWDQYVWQNWLQLAINGT